MPGVPKAGERYTHHDWWNPDRDHPQLQDCVLWAPLYEGGGLVASDLIARRTATMRQDVAATAWSLQPVGDTATFDGIDDGVEFAYDRELIYQPQITLYARFRYTGSLTTGDEKNLFDAFPTSQPAYLLRYKPDSGRWEFFIQTSGGSPNIRVTDFADETEDREWHDIAAVYDGNEIKIWFDGQWGSTTSSSVGGNIRDRDTGVLIGGMWATAPDEWAGEIQNARIYKRGLDHEDLMWIKEDPWAPMRRDYRAVGKVEAAPSGFNPAWATPATRIGI